MSFGSLEAKGETEESDTTDLQRWLACEEGEETEQNKPRQRSTAWRAKTTSMRAELRRGGAKKNEKENNPPEYLNLVSANVGGSAGAWRMLDEIAKQDADVVCLQEVALTSREAEAFGKVAKQRGYRFYCAGGYTHADR